MNSYPKYPDSWEPEHTASDGLKAEYRISEKGWAGAEKQETHRSHQKLPRKKKGKYARHIIFAQIARITDFNISVNHFEPL